MNLPQRSLGSSRVMITKTGFGAWAIGGGWAACRLRGDHETVSA